MRRIVMTEKPDRLHHVALAVANIAAAVNWYRSQFDVDIAYQDDSWALLRFANIDLALVLPSAHPPHIAAECSEAGRFGPLSVHRDGTSSVYVRDPWGNAVEFIERGS